MSGLTPGSADWLSQLAPALPTTASQVARAPAVISVYGESLSKWGSISALSPLRASRPPREPREEAGRNQAEPFLALFPIAWRGQVRGVVGEGES